MIRCTESKESRISELSILTERWRKRIGTKVVATESFWLSFCRYGLWAHGTSSESAVEILSKEDISPQVFQHPI